MALKARYDVLQAAGDTVNALQALADLQAAQQLASNCAAVSNGQVTPDTQQQQQSNQQQLNQANQSVFGPKPVPVLDVTGCPTGDSLDAMLMYAQKTGNTQDMTDWNNARLLAVQCRQRVDSAIGGATNTASSNTGGGATNTASSNTEMVAQRKPHRVTPG
jgi:hypothetical protein